MFNNWWKRLFNVDEEEDDIYPRSSGPGDNEATYRSTIGRIEETERKVQVRMVNQYPAQASTKRYEPSFKKVRRARTHVNDQMNDQKKNAQEPPQSKKKYDEKESPRRPEPPSTRPKIKTPFARTEVPSPIYGFRKRPNANYVPFKFESNHSIEKKKRAEGQSEEMQEANRMKRRFREINPSVNHERKPASEATFPTNKPVESEPKPKPISSPKNRYNENLLETNQQQKKLDSNVNREEQRENSPRSQEDQSVYFQENNHEPDQVKDDHITWHVEVSADQNMIPEEGPKQDSNEASIGEKKENIITAHENDKAQKEQQPETAGNLSSNVHTERRRQTKVPFNVLMYRSDKKALQKRHVNTKQKEESPTVTHHSPQQMVEVKKSERSTSIEPLSVQLLNTPDDDTFENEGWLDEKQQILQQTLENFQVKAEMVGFVEGPSVTRFDIRLHPGVKVNKVINLTEDIKLSLAARQIRIAPVPGKNIVGIEVPNDHRKPVYLKNLLDSDAFREETSPLTAALGQDVTGENIVTDLSKMPHGLIAGATGSGKSVCIHSLILSLIYKSNPDQLRLILIDPKVVELAAYQKLPHLATPVITQPKEASLALKWAVDEMERRYHVFAAEGVRDITRYNAHMAESNEKMPYIVIIIDELADLMMVSPQDVEEAICRIAQKARAAGIHLILATQRPSVDVITGLIKSNIPTRIAFSVSSQADSRTILDSGGAERLLGQGDMLFSENGARTIKRLQGCFVSDEEIDRITNALAKRETPPYLFEKEELASERQDGYEEEDELFGDAGIFVIEQGQASVSSLQRRFRIGYNRAARLVDQLESLGVISEANGSKPRSILMSLDLFKENIMNAEMS